MKFNQMTYTRPDVGSVCQKLTALCGQVTAATGGQDLLLAFEQYSVLFDDFRTASSLAEIRYTINTEDAFYSAEKDYLDEQSPVVNENVLALYRTFLASAHKAALGKLHGDILLQKMELAVSSSDERLIALQQAENTLATRYEKLYASAKIPFMGQQCTISQLTPYKQSTDRSIRLQAVQAEGTFFDGHKAELDAIFDEMVKNRSQQAKLLGYSSFTPLGDIRMERLGYTRADIAALRKAVVKDIVPICSKLKKAQAQRLGLQDLAWYDEPLVFASGNPCPKGSPEELLQAGQAMYRALSPQTAEFIDFMMEGDLFDVLSRPGKAPGGYCTSIPGYKSPFIFSNFNGTAGDVDVLTHEAGHAFASYISQRMPLAPELRSPGLESCEIHSMSMEFLTSSYHELFFKEDAQRYALYHAAEALTFLPYGCAVDEFQETIYDQPTLTPAQRNELWQSLERKYRPWINFESLPFYSRGAGWQRQLHIYEAPFYYIDYCLAQCVALGFFNLHLQDPSDAWQRYMALVNQAGTKTYTGLVHAAGMAAPFEPAALQNIGNSVHAWLTKGFEELKK